MTYYATRHAIQELPVYSDSAIGHARSNIIEAILESDKACAKQKVKHGKRIVTRGCSINQVNPNASIRMFGFRFRHQFTIDPKVTLCINPVILRTWGKRLSTEGCLSCPGKPYAVYRPRFALVSYYDENMKKHTKLLGPHNANVFAHELDHLNGRMISDRKES